MNRLDTLLDGKKIMGLMNNQNTFFLNFNGDELHTDSASHKPFWNGKELTSRGDIIDLECVREITWNENTDTLTVINNDDTSIDIQIPTLNVIVDVEYDETSKDITFIKRDGTTFTINVKDLVDKYTGLEGTQIKVEVNEDTNVISAILLEGSISEEKLGWELRDKIFNKHYIKNITFDENTGEITVEFPAGNTRIIDLPTNTMITNVFYDDETKEIVLVRKNGTQIRQLVSDLVDTYFGDITTTIDVTIDEHEISAELLEGVIFIDALTETLREKIEEIELVSSCYDDFCKEILPGEFEMILAYPTHKIYYHITAPYETQNSYYQYGTLRQGGHTDVVSTFPEPEKIFFDGYNVHNNTPYTIKMRGTVTRYMEC